MIKKSPEVFRAFSLLLLNRFYQSMRSMSVKSIELPSAKVMVPSASSEKRRLLSFVSSMVPSVSVTVQSVP